MTTKNARRARRNVARNVAAATNATPDETSAMLDAATHGVDYSSCLPSDVAPTVDTAPAVDASPAVPVDAPATALAVAASVAATVAAPVTPAAPPRVRRTIGTIAAGDVPTRDPLPTRTISLADRFASLAIDAAAAMFNGAFLNVTPPSVLCDAATLDPTALGYVSRPHTVTRDALTLAASLLDSAAAIDLANGSTAGANASHVRAAVILYSHDRAMRATRTRPVGYFDTNGVSGLDVAASLARAAARLAHLPVSGLGNRAALAVTLPDLRAAVATRLAALSA